MSYFAHVGLFSHTRRSFFISTGLFPHMLVSFHRWWSLLVCRSFLTCVGLFSHTGCDNQRNQETGGTSNGLFWFVGLFLLT